MKTVFLISFTNKGQALAEKLAEGLRHKGIVTRATRCGKPLSLSEFASTGFKEADALIFVGAMGIAIRAIAPHVVSKVKDPAVVVIDEGGNNAISVLSGHMGGGNELTETVAEISGAKSVITTATDVEGVFAIDLWTKRNRCKILKTERIKLISAALLAGERVIFASDFDIAGDVPEKVEFKLLKEREIDVHAATDASDNLGFGSDVGESKTKGVKPNVLVTVSRAKAERANEKCLVAVPQIACLGIGCRRGTTEDAIEACFEDFMSKSDISEHAIRIVCSIDLKKDEEGLLRFCRKHEFEFESFSAEELSEVKGDFSSSDFVRQITGVDNVCERSAICGSGGKIFKRKMAKNGVTMAIAIAPPSLDWRL